MKFRIALAAVALLVLGMSGVASAQASTGNLIFVHGVPGGPPVDLVIFPSDGDEFLPDIAVAAGTRTAPIPLPADTHYLEVYAGESLLGEGQFTIVAGATTTITATAGADGVKVTISDPVADPRPTPTATPTAPQTSTPRPQTVTVPTRVETGAGGAATGDAGELVLGGLAAAAVLGGALTFGLRRRTAA